MHHPIGGKEKEDRIWKENSHKDKGESLQCGVGEKNCPNTRTNNQRKSIEQGSWNQAKGVEIVHGTVKASRPKEEAKLRHPTRGVEEIAKVNSYRQVETPNPDG